MLRKYGPGLSFMWQTDIQIDELGLLSQRFDAPEL